VFNYKPSWKYTYSYNLFIAIVKYFLQLLTNNVDKYKSKMKLQSKVCAMCQHHNNSHYVPLANLVENYPTNLIKGCCQLYSTSGWTSFVD
jgi:hypothetical protein